MKVARSFYDLAVGMQVFNDHDNGIVIDTQNQGEIVTVAWIGNREIEDYNEDTYAEYGFSAYALV